MHSYSSNNIIKRHYVNYIFDFVGLLLCSLFRVAFRMA